MDVNEYLFAYLYGFAHQSDTLDALIIFLATDFGLVASFALLYFLYRHEDLRRGLRELLLVAGSGAFAWMLAHVIKYFYPMHRPGLLDATIVPLFAHGTGIDAFPSGHATFYAGIAAALFFYHRKLGWTFAAFAFLIGLARVMAGIHSPLDIAAGWLLGIAVASALHIVVVRYSRRAR